MKKGRITSFIICAVLCSGLLCPLSANAETKFSNNNKKGSGLEMVGSGRKFDFYSINGTLINEHPRIDSRITLVPGQKTAEGLGLQYEVQGNGLKLQIKADGNTYVFSIRDNFYTKNGITKIYNKITEENGVKKAEDVKNTTSAGQIYIPLSFFTMELGYSDAFTVDNQWCLTLGKPSTVLAKYQNTRKENFITGEKINKDKTVQEGWKCPVLKSVSVDNTHTDARTLINELEFDDNGGTSATYYVDGVCQLSVGPTAWGKDASHFTGIFYPGHISSFEDVNLKMRQVEVQVFKFYFPNNYMKAIDIMNNTFKTKQSVRYIIDGRDVVFGGDHIFMSRVNGKLQQHLAKFKIEGTIGTPYNVKTDYTGRWSNNGMRSDIWYYLDAYDEVTKGTKVIDGTTYYFDKDGKMVYGIRKDGTKINSDFTDAN